MPCGCEDIPTVRSKGPSGPCCHEDIHRAVEGAKWPKEPSGLSHVSALLNIFFFFDAPTKSP